MTTPLSHAHEAIGRAVWTCQTFETVVVVCSEIVRIHRQIDAGKNIDGLINPSRFKVPTSALLKELAGSNDIAPELEDRIASLVERRHQLIHRWFLENGWPSDDDSTELNKISTFASEVAEEARQITLLLLRYVIHWGNPNVEEQAKIDNARVQLKQLFKNAHLFSYERDSHN